MESFDMQRMKLNQKSCGRILYEFAGHVANNMKLGLFGEAAFLKFLYGINIYNIRYKTYAWNSICIDIWNLHIKPIYESYICNFHMLMTR